MSNKTNDGGPAFPIADTYHANGQVQYGHNGMSLLDWFAGKALSGMMANPTLISNIGEFSDKKFRACYFIADTMLSEPERGMK